MIAKFLVLLGVLLCFLGTLLQYVPGILNWFGRLPGDIHIGQGDNLVVIPLTTMIVLSLLISFAAYLMRAFYERYFLSPIDISEMTTKDEVDRESKTDAD